MRLFTACALTIVIETLFFLAVGYREGRFVLLCICTNALTNLSLNLIVWLLFSLGVNLTAAVYPLEAVVVAVEFIILGAYCGTSWKLFGLTLAANALSYSAGLLIFGHV